MHNRDSWTASCVDISVMLCKTYLPYHSKTYFFDQERKELSLAYLEERYGVVKEEPFIEPKIIVLHWTAISSLEASFNAMNPACLLGARMDISSSSALNVSTQFLVDRDGTIFW